MSDQVLVAIIAAMGLTSSTALAAGVPILLSARKHAKAGAADALVAREQVKNDHGTNLRDDLDALSAAMRKGFETQARNTRHVRAELRAHVATHKTPAPAPVVSLTDRVRRKRTA